MKDPNQILAFNDPWHDSSFCLYGDQIVHIESERYTRVKYEPVNPILTFCELFPEKINDFGCIVFEESPNAVASFARHLIRARLHGASPAASYTAMPYGTELARESGSAVIEKTDRVKEFIEHLLRPEIEIFFAGHHASHAANAFFSSGFESALTVTLDGIGHDYLLDGSGRTLTTVGTDSPTHRINGSVFRCEGRRCTPVHHVTDCSIGFAWSRVAEHVMGRGLGEEGTVMAMAALGDARHYRRDLAEPWVWLPTPDGDLDPTSSAGLQACLARLRQSLTTEQDRFDLAAALQEASEIRFRDLLARFIRPGDRDLCLAGGTMLNCQMVGKVMTWFPDLRRVFIPPAPYDGGICIGAAQLVFHGEKGFPVQWNAGLPPFAMGAEYSRLSVVGACRSARVNTTEATSEEALALLAQGKVLGWFSGAAESGRRALGHRSILADPRIGGMKERLNAQIKHRQWYRPFAPMVLAEEVSSWFECGSDFRSPYMSFAIQVRPECRHRVPAIIHLDGSARVQTVHRELNPGLHAILSQWHAISGVPMLLNTSFNEREPIVESPTDALNTMNRAHLDGIFFADVGILATPRSDVLSH